MITTTLNKIYKCEPCKTGWKKLCKNLGGKKAYGGDTPLKFSQIIESNGLNDALWCLRSICPKYDKEVRLFAADCAERVLHIYERHYPGDDRPRKAIQASKDYANGLITIKQRNAAEDAGWAAARDAAGAAAGAAAWAAAGAAARDAGWAAAEDAAGAAARAAARAAAGAAQKQIQANMLIEYFG